MKSSKSFLILKQQTQEALDFVVLLCTAVPQLEHAFNAHSLDSSTFLATNSEFGESQDPYSTEKRTIPLYKQIQGANLLISYFSLFESYFFALIDEVINFHGGEEEIIKMIDNRIRKPVLLSTNEEAQLSKLRKKFRGNHIDRYRNATIALRTTQMTWPTETFALYGFRQAMENRKRWKSVDIPKVAINLLLCGITEQEVSKFHNIRGDRNDIAHGKSLKYSLDKSLDASKFLFALATKIDLHVSRLFFVIEKLR